jgi:diguanylate cyclase (GGDEF)-like protein
MFKGFQNTQPLPVEVTRRLEAMLFGVPSSTAVYLAGLVVVPITLWWRSHDLIMTTIAALSVVTNISRILIVAWFNRHYPDHLSGRPQVYWIIVQWVGSLYSLAMAVLAVRAFAVGETLSIAIVVVAVAGYITGVVIRASAVPRMAVPHLTLVFLPMIVAAACAADRGWLVISFLLALFWIASIELSKTVYQRMSAQLLAEYQLSQLARTDYLTGLPNRVHFDTLGLERLQEARTGTSHLVLALIDLDGFKAVNDVHGHAAGDELLKQVGGRIRSVLTTADLAARLGGDEFAILFGAACDADHAQAIGEKLTTLLEQPFEVVGVAVQISGSFGLAGFEGAADSFTAIVARADQAMYRAKNAGRASELPPADGIVAMTAVPSLAPAHLSFA